MKHLFIGLMFCFFVTTLAFSESKTNISSKILEGQDVNMTLPWMAGMYISQDHSGCLHSEGCFDRYTFSCAAALIHAQWLITAAHCVENSLGALDPKAVKLFLGEYELQDVVEYQSIEEIIIHEQYWRSDDYKFDIALIKLEDPVLFHPIEIIDAGKESLITPGDALMLAGWGRGIKEEFYYYPDLLQMTQLDYVEPAACYEIFEFLTKLDDLQMCAGGDGVHDACDGDSGGPLIVNMAGRWKLVGLVSFGIDVCALNGYPTVFTRLSQYKAWITDQGVPVNETELGHIHWFWLILFVVLGLKRRLHNK